MRHFFLFFGRYTPELLLDLGIYNMQRLNEKNIWEIMYFHVGINSKLASYFASTTLFSWSHLEVFGLLSYDCCVVAFRYRISRLNTFLCSNVRCLRGGAFPTQRHHYTQGPCRFFILAREIQPIIMWSQTVRQSKPNNRNESKGIKQV